jgi:uncharacterized protein YbdZ (MbtH family)
MGKKLFWGMVAVLLAAGVGWTWVDYQAWRHAELDHYGQGWKDMEKPALKLSQMYQGRLSGVRLRLPEGWQVEERDGVITAGGMIEVRISKSSENLTDLVNKEVAGMIAMGRKLTWEREYAVTEKMDMTVITWSEELPGGTAVRKQKVMGKMENRLMELEATVEEGKWGDYEKTLWEIYKNLELI